MRIDYPIFNKLLATAKMCLPLDITTQVELERTSNWETIVSSSATQSKNAVCPYIKQ